MSFLLSWLTSVPRHIYLFLRDGPTSYNAGSTECAAMLREPELGWDTDYAVRLQIDQYGSLRIYGFPEQGTDLAGTLFARPLSRRRMHTFLHLRTRTPAYIDYIMGAAWQERLLRDYRMHYCDVWPTGDVILRPAWQTVSTTITVEQYAIEERAHCLRMRRCGAIATRTQADVVLCETNGLVDHDAPPLLGWPEGGGVWVLPGPPSIDPEYAEDSVEHWWERYERAERDLIGQCDMRDVCAVLETAGAQYYEEPSDCALLIKLDIAR